MAKRKTVDFDVSPKTIMLNPVTTDYKATFQNNTGNNLTAVTFSNINPQRGGTPVFSAAATAITVPVADGDFWALNDPYVVMQVTGTVGGTIDFVEVG